MTDQASRLRAMVAGHKGEAVEDTSAVRQPDTDAHIIAVTSGKGGVGKTTIAVNLAILFAEAAERVLLVDADLGLANVDVMLGIDFGRHIGHLLLDEYHPEDLAVMGPRGISVISGGSGLRELADATEAQRRLLIGKLVQYYRRFDRVVIDTSPGIGAEVNDFLSSADQVLLVTTTEPTSLRDTYAALKSMAAFRHNDSSISLVVNMAASETQAAQAVGVLNEVTGRFLDRCFDDWRRIAVDSLVGRSVRARKPLVCEYPRSAASLSLRQIAGELKLPKRSQIPAQASRRR